MIAGEQKLDAEETGFQHKMNVNREVEQQQ